MAMASVSTDGEVKIPQDILERLHIHAGDEVELDVEQDGSIRLSPKRRSVTEVRSMLAGKTHVAATVEDMDRAVAEGFRTGRL